MKRFEKCKRILAFLLVTLMIISQSSVITLAEELSPDTRNAQNQEATAVAETPEESEQEPSVPDPDNIDKQEPEEVQPSVPEESPETTEHRSRRRIRNPHVRKKQRFQSRPLYRQTLLRKHRLTFLRRKQRLNPKKK